MDPLARRLTDTFVELARIDSPSFEEAAVADAIQGHLENLGCVTWRDDAHETTPSDTGNLFGTLKGLAGLPSLAFTAHMDTVEPGRGIRPRVDEQAGVILSSGDTVLGADDKAAIAVILEALRTLVQEGHPHGDIHVVMTVAEEKGLMGAKAMDLTGFAADNCFVMDAEGPVGRATVAAPWQNTVKARIHGKAAHAGVNPSDGINAIVAAAKAIASMRLGQIDEETTASIGRIEGGRATNIVPDLVEVAGETRSHDRGKLKAVTDAMVEAFHIAEEEGCRVEVEVIDEYHGFAIGEDEPIRRLFDRACARVGIECGHQSSNGGSDANIFNDAGIPALVLACGMEKPHSTDESVRIDELRAAHDLVIALAAEVAGG